VSHSLRGSLCPAILEVAFPRWSVAGVVNCGPQDARPWLLQVPGYATWPVLQVVAWGGMLEVPFLAKRALCSVGGLSSNSLVVRWEAALLKLDFSQGCLYLSGEGSL